MHMKKSELCEYIRLYLNKVLIQDVPKSAAEDILHIIEMAGMRPPKITEFVPIKGRGLEVGYTTFSWESEDAD